MTTPEEALKTTSDFVCKIMPCCFNQSVFDFVYHQYGICRMYTEENPQDFRLPHRVKPAKLTPFKTLAIFFQNIFSPPLV